MPNIFAERPGYPLDNLESKMLDSSYSKGMKRKFGVPPDFEKCKEELIKFKQSYNKKIKEMHMLKIENFKLQVK